jgi:hypothetical protein
MINPEIETMFNKENKTFLLKNLFVKIKHGLYPGFKLNIRAICIIFIFSLFPSEKITNKYISKFLQTITNYTGPVYYLHIPLSRYLSYYNKDVKYLTFSGLFIDYFACYCVGFFGTLIFGKTPLKYLFC